MGVVFTGRLWLRRSLMPTTAAMDGLWPERWVTGENGQMVDGRADARTDTDEEWPAGRTVDVPSTNGNG